MPEECVLYISKQFLTCVLHYEHPFIEFWCVKTVFNTFPSSFWPAYLLWAPPPWVLRFLCHCQVIAEHVLCGEEVEGIKEMFNTMDTNKTGFLTFDQLKAGLQKVDPQLSEGEIQQLMEAVRFSCAVILSCKWWILISGSFVILSGAKLRW